ncbi:MAG: hypothetical protein KF713_00320 [Turneriella sp.]|nr:hypothetical protein [Turneriella sp.]
MNRSKKIPWFPKADKKVYEMMFDWRMLVSYFGAAAFFIGLFFIPFVEEITGVQPWEVALVGAMHFCGGMLPQMLFRKMNMNKFMLWETFSDRFVMSSLALFGSSDASFLWLFLVFICVVEAVAVAPSIYSAATIFITPLAAWGVFIFFDLRDFSTRDLSVILTVSLITLMVWLFIASSTSQYRGAQREVENSKAQAELEHRRAELSRDIHDAIAAIFTRILAVQKNEDTETATLTREGLKQLRDIVTALQVENTSIGFLSSWLNHYSQQYFENTKIRADFTVECDSADATLEPVRIIHVMRIYQELCQNTLKHSGATQVRTVFTQKQDEITLEFSDNGRGVSAEASRGQGLYNIEERALALSAKIDYVTNPKGGVMTRMVLRQSAVQG